MTRLTYLTITDEEIVGAKLRAIELGARNFFRVCDRALDRGHGSKLFYNDLQRARVAEFLNTDGRCFVDEMFECMTGEEQLRIMDLVNW